MNCAVRTGEWEPHVTAAEADDVINECSEKSENHVSCANPLRAEFIADVGGLAFDTALAPSTIPALPKLIPTLERSFIWSNPESISSSVVSISLSDVFRSPPREVAGVLHASESFKFNERIMQSPMFAQKLVLLNMSGQDALIERTWMQQERIALFDNLYRLGFRFATTPNFSVFGGECPLGHRINQKKSMVCADLLQRAGITPILHIYAMNEFHLSAYEEYLKDQRAVTVVTINCTRQRKEPEEVGRIKTVVARLLAVRPDLRIILQGLNIRDARRFCAFEANIHYMVSTPTHNALMRKENFYDEQGRILNTLHGSPRHRTELVGRNVDAYTAFLQNVCLPE